MSDLQVVQPQSVTEIKSQIQAIQQVMKSVMKVDQHYGEIPGMKAREGEEKKYVLLKPGAEKIMATFRIAPKFETEDLSNSDECRYRVTAIAVYAPDGTFLGQGMGECSSNEEKYKWRASICPEEFEETAENRRREKWKKGYKGKPNYKVQQIRTDHADLANTVLKMAVKRALVAMVLTVTAASDIFAQDLEDIPTEGEVQNEETKAHNQPSEPTRKFHCSECNVEIKQEVYDYSTKHFKKALCFTHQKAVKNV